MVKSSPGSSLITFERIIYLWNYNDCDKDDYDYDNDNDDENGDDNDNNDNDGDDNDDYDLDCSCFPAWQSLCLKIELHWIFLPKAVVPNYLWWQFVYPISLKVYSKFVCRQFVPIVAYESMCPCIVFVCNPCEDSLWICPAS